MKVVHHSVIFSQLLFPDFKLTKQPHPTLSDFTVVLRNPGELQHHYFHGDPMSNNLPALHIRKPLPGQAEVLNFLDELEAVALSCQTVVTTPLEPANKPVSYLESIAAKYAFAPPRRELYKAPVPTHCANVKSIIPAEIMWQFNKKCRELLGTFNATQHKH